MGKRCLVSERKGWPSAERNTGFHGRSFFWRLLPNTTQHHFNTRTYQLGRVKRERRRCKLFVLSTISITGLRILSKGPIYKTGGRPRHTRKQTPAMYTDRWTLAHAMLSSRSVMIAINHVNSHPYFTLLSVLNPTQPATSSLIQPDSSQSQQQPPWPP